jgi:hypothetical protein
VQQALQNCPCKPRLRDKRASHPQGRAEHALPRETYGDLLAFYHI